MTINQLECFIAAATYNSFSLAARKLYISQPNLSKSIELLEKELGVTLFIRSNKGVSLTVDGIHLLDRATDIIKRLDNINEYYSSRKEQAFSLKISGQPISPVIQALGLMGAKGIPTIFHESNRYRVIQDVVNNQSELGVIMTSTADPQRFSDIFEENHLDFTLIAESSANVYVNKNHPLAANLSITPKQLSAYPQLKFNLDDFTENNIKNYSVSVSITNSCRYAKQLIKTTLTFMTQTPWDTGIFRDDDIVYRPLEDSSIKVQIGFCRRKNRILSPRAEEFIRLMKNFITE